MKKQWIISAACLLAALILMAWGFRAPGEPTEGGASYYALMIDDYGASAMQFKQGAQDAAKQLGASVSFLTCARGDSVEVELNKLMDTIEPLKPDGVILPEGAQCVLARALHIAEPRGVAVVCLFETDEKGAVQVVSDDAFLGRQLGEGARSNGIRRFAAFYDRSDPQPELAAGLREALSDVELIGCANADEALERARALSGETACFALNAEYTLALANGGVSPLWGVDPGDERVTLLESGAVEGLGMRMPYAQGYLALTTAARGSQPKEPPAPVPTRVVTRETMYLSENVKLMFPLLQ